MDDNEPVDDLDIILDQEDEENSTEITTIINGNYVYMFDKKCLKKQKKVTSIVKYVVT